MTEREAFNFRELKLHILAQQQGKCLFCDAQATELAHRISKSKRNLKRYGKAVIHHPRNLIGTCSRCNQLALIDGHPRKIQRLVTDIVKDIVEGI